MWIVRMLRRPRAVQSLISLREREEFFFHAEVLFTGFRRPAHTGEAMMFCSHRPIVDYIDHGVLPGASFFRPPILGERGGTLKRVPY
jgi:hypothetical protein